MLSAQGEIVEWFGTARDVTSRRMAEEELRRANADLERFAYTASHDLQEPLRGIKIYTELLTSRYRDKLDGQALEFFEFVRKGAARMERLVHDLLAYTRTASLEISCELTGSNEAVRLVLANLAQSIAETNANIVCAPLPSVPMHAIHIQQLFQNLIGNAIKYHRPGVAPEVRISAERKGSAWKFCVSDNGIGVKPEHQELIFGLFKRLHGDEFQGTGLGLAICQRIVERYGGKIWVASESGSGSHFYFTIPE
jgi:light-regulated signal transduction histidine kinase (bacteriophytochrome)